MNIDHHLIRASILGLLGGCSAAVGPEGDASPSMAIIEASVSASMPMDAAGECKPLGAPITGYVNGVFGPDDLVEETATVGKGGECVHQQVLAAPADAFATLAYSVVCQGSGDAQVCGATERRRCAVDLMMQMAQTRTEPLSMREPRFGLSFSVPPQEAEARTALYHRAQQEVGSLLDESETVMGQLAEGTRDCPDEDLDAIEARYGAALDMERMLDVLLAQ